MKLLPITNSGSDSTESLVHSVASKSTESLELDLGLQSDHSRESVLQDRSLEEQFESCVSLCKKEIEEALEAAKISTYAKKCFHPIARQIDDELIRLEIWALDFGTKDGSWEELSELVTKNDTVGRHPRKILDDLNASLEKIGREMKFIQSFVEDAARSTETSDNDHWTTRVDVAVTQTNETVNTLSSTVRTFISHRDLSSLKEAIDDEKSPYDGLRHESDDTIDSLHKQHQELIETNKNDQNEQNIRLQKGPHKRPQWKAEDSMSPFSGRAVSPEDNLDALLRPTPPDKDLPGLDTYPNDFNQLQGDEEHESGIKKEDATLTDDETAPWNSLNLLSLDGGGVRSYWSLLMLLKLMQSIATEEEKIAREESQRKEEGEEIIEEHDGKEVHHSFWPQALPENVSQVPRSWELRRRMEETNDPEARRRAIPATQRYLPCHYFDLICGSSTGALIAIMLGRFRMTVPDCMLEYESLAAEVFGRPRFLTTLRFGVVDRTKYEAAHFENVFVDVTKRRCEQRARGQRRIAFPSKRGLCKTFVTSLQIGSSQPAFQTLYLIRSYDCLHPSPSVLELPKKPNMAFKMVSATGPSTLFSDRSSIATRPSTMFSDRSSIATGPSTLFSDRSSIATGPSTLFSDRSSIATGPSNMFSDRSSIATGPSTLFSDRSSIAKRPSTMIGDRSDTGMSNIYGESFVNFEPAQDFEIWEVARAATAAPLFFNPLKIHIPGSKEYMSLSDAGFDHNNPTNIGTGEIKTMYDPKSIGIVVSVGTAGRDEGSLRRGLSTFQPSLREIVQKATDPEGVHTYMEAKSSAEGFSYYRLNDLNGLKMQLDEWEPKPGHFNVRGSGSKTLEKIHIAFYSWLSSDENRNLIQDCAENLVRSRRARSTTNPAKWERYATGAEFTCRMQGCERENFENRDEFRRHLARDHGLKPQDLEAEINHCRRDWQYQPAPS